MEKRVRKEGKAEEKCPPVKKEKMKTGVEKARLYGEKGPKEGKAEEECPPGKRRK